MLVRHPTLPRTCTWHAPTRHVWGQGKAAGSPLPTALLRDDSSLPAACNRGLFLINSANVVIPMQVIFVQYGNADACEEKATAIAKATQANNVFKVILPISRLVVVAVCL